MPPSGAGSDPGAGLLRPGLLAGLAALAAAFLTARLVRWAGRERIPARWVPEPGRAGGAGEVRMDVKKMGSLASVARTPPPELTPAQGGVLHADEVREQHKVAWLISAAADGQLDLHEERSGGLTLVRRSGRSATPSAVLDVMFGGGGRVPLGTYDQFFAAAWRGVGDELRDWQRTCGLWDRAADRRRTVLPAIGAALAAVGVLLVGIGAAWASRSGGSGLAMAGAGGVLAGAGLATLVTGWELRTRTPVGSDLWLRVESFRRFLSTSTPRDAEDLAERAPVHAYPAWVVALGELDRWSAAAADSTSKLHNTDITRYTALAPLLGSVITATATRPQTHGGLSGGTGHSGGGGGGGSGGSW